MGQVKGKWKPVQIMGKPKTDKASGNKITFHQLDDGQPFDEVKAKRYRERFGTLKVKRGNKKVMDCEGKLTESVTLPKESGGDAIRKLDFVPTSRLDSSVLAEVYDNLDVELNLEFDEAQKTLDGMGDDDEPGDNSDDDDDGATVHDLTDAA